jgi:hypothetical protein
MAHQFTRGSTPIHRLLSTEDSLPASGEISVAFFCNISSFNGSDRFFAKEANAGTQDGYMAWTAFGFGGQPSIQIEWNFSGGTAGSMFAPPPTGVDQHLGFSWDLAGLGLPRFYIDGVEQAAQGSASPSGTPNDTTNALLAFMGTARFDLDQCPTGLVWDIVVYDRVLTDTEFADLASGTDPTTIPNLIARIPLDSASITDTEGFLDLSNSDTGGFVDYPPSGSNLAGATSLSVGASGALTGLGALSGSASLDIDASNNAARIAFCTWGASYGIGLEGSPVLTTVQPYDNQRAINSTDNRAGNPGTASLIDLVPWTDLEDPGTAFCNQLSHLGYRTNLIYHERSQSGSDIFNFTSGSQRFADQMGQIDDVVTLVSPESVEYRAIHAWSLGYFEEVVGGLAYATFESTLLDLLDDYRTELTTRTGQTFEPRLYFQQPGWWQAIGNTTPIEPPLDYAFNLLALAQSNTDVVLANSTVWMAIGPDNIHPVAAAYRQDGEQRANAYYVQEVLGQRWLPLHMTRAVASGSTVTIDWHIPAVEYGFHTEGQPALVLDTDDTPAWRTDAADSTTHGLRYIPPVGGAARNITNVAVSGEQLVLTLDGVAEPGYRIGHADIGGAPPAQARTNIRDNWNGTSESGDPTWNWAVSQQIDGELISDIAGTSTLSLSPSATLAGTGALVGAASISLAASGDLAGVGPTALSGRASMTMASSGELVGHGRLVGTGLVSLSLSAGLTLYARGSGAASVSLAGSGALGGIGRLAGSTVIALIPVGLMSAMGALAGAAGVSLSASGALTVFGVNNNPIAFSLAGGDVVHVTLAGGQTIFVTLEGGDSAEYEVEG